MKKKLIIYSSLCLLSLIIFIIMCILVKNSGGNPLKIDEAVRDFFYNIRGNEKGFNYYLANIVTYLGDTICVVIFAVILLILTKGDNKIFSFLVGILLALCINIAVKEIFQRDRPYAEFMWATETDESFPSGHSLASAFMYSFAIYLIINSNFKKVLKIILSIISVLLIITVVISRMTLGVHYFTDVIAGMSLGLLMSFLAMIFEEILIKFGIFEKPIFVSIYEKIKSKKNKEKNEINDDTNSDEINNKEE